MAYLYRHIRLDTNQVFYIGVGSDSKGRHRRAHAKDGRNHIWKKIVSKTTFIVEIMLDNLSWETACEKEVEFIQLYGRIKDGGTLSNIALGGEGNPGTAPSEFCRQRSLEARKGKPSPKKGKPSWMKGELHPRFGRKMSQEQRDKLSALRKGRKTWNKGVPMTEERRLANKLGKPRKGVLQFDEYGKFIKEFHSLSDAAKEIGCVKAVIWRACAADDKRIVRGFRWKYKNKELSKDSSLLIDNQPVAATIVATVSRTE